MLISFILFLKLFFLMHSIQREFITKFLFNSLCEAQMAFALSIPTFIFNEHLILKGIK